MTRDKILDVIRPFLDIDTSKDGWGFIITKLEESGAIERARRVYEALESETREPSEGAQIEVTKSMLEAGFTTLADLIDDAEAPVRDIGDSDLTAIYRAMRAAEPAQEQRDARAEAMEEAAAELQSFVSIKQTRDDIEHYVNSVHGGNATVDEFVPEIGRIFAKRILSLIQND